MGLNVVFDKISLLVLVSPTVKIIIIIMIIIIIFQQIRDARFNQFIKQATTFTYTPIHSLTYTCDKSTIPPHITVWLG